MSGGAAAPYPLGATPKLRCSVNVHARQLTEPTSAYPIKKIENDWNILTTRAQ